MADKFEDLRVYMAVIDSGGVNAAAAALGIAKSAVSRRLAELEQRLGAELIARGNRSFEPTAVGRRYYERARELLDALAALDAEAGTGDGSHSERVTIAAGTPLVSAVAAAMASLARTGGAGVEVINAASSIEGAAAGIWIGTAPGETDAYEQQTGPALGMTVVGSPSLLEETGRPKSFADLRALPGIAVASRPDGGWRFGKEGAHQPVITLTVPDDASAAAAAIASGGLARIPAHLAAGPVAAGHLEQVLAAREPSPVPVELWISKEATGNMRRIVDHLVAALSDGWAR